MSDGQRSRRRFLADLLFLGGALGAGAFIVKATGEEPRPVETPAACPTESCPVESSPTPNTQCTPMVKGDTVAPQPPPQPDEPVTGGKPMAPPPSQTDGVYAVPPTPAPQTQLPPGAKGDKP